MRDLPQRKEKSLLMRTDEKNEIFRTDRKEREEQTRLSLEISGVQPSAVEDWAGRTQGTKSKVTLPTGPL